MNRLPRKERINHNNRFFIDPRPREREREREKPGFHQFCQDLYQPSNRKIGRGCGSRFQKTKKEPRDNPVEWKHPRWLSDPANTPVYKYSQWPIWPSLFHPLTLHPSSRPTEDSSFCFFFFVSFYFLTVEKRLDDYSRGEFRARTPIPDSKGVRHDQGGGGFIAPTYETFASGVKRG